MITSIRVGLDEIGNAASRIVASKNYKYLCDAVVWLQIALLVFSLLYFNAVLFFLSLKILLAISVARIILERALEERHWPLDWLVVLPGVWSAIYGFENGNIGARYELAVYVMAPIAYLLVFLKPAPALLARIKPVIKVICALNLLVFFFLYFTESGSVRSFLEEATRFRIQYPQGYIKVNTQQITPLIFLLPAVAGYYYFRQTLGNFILVTAAILMALLSGRKAVILLFVALSFLTWLYHFCRHRSFKALLKLMSPWVVALVVFPQIANFDTAKLFDVLFGSFPETNAMLVRGRPGGAEDVLSAGKFADLYALPSNACALENYMAAGVAPDKLGPGLRSAQLKILTREVRINPGFGQGLGYVTADCIRSDEQPWRFEMTYLGMAINLGLVGLGILALAYLRWMKIALSRLLPRRETVPILCASAFFLICSASNTYILAVEYLWIFFLPFFLSRLVPGNGRIEPEQPKADNAA